MKKFITILLAALGLVTAQADPTPTNAIRMQDFPAATLPLNAGDQLVIVQNYGTRRTTVDDFNYGAKVLAMAASNTLNLKILTNATAAAGGQW